MLITFTLLIILSISAFTISMYSSIVPFIQNAGNIDLQQQTYYNAYENIETALLVSKYQSAGFNGSGGYHEGVFRGPISDYKSNNIPTTYRTIQGRASQIPVTPHKQTPYINNEETNFNKLQLGESIYIPLMKDTTNEYENYYANDEEMSLFQGSYLRMTAKLPENIRTQLGESTQTLLCDQEKISCIIDIDKPVIDDTLRERKIHGKYNGLPFTILPHTTINNEGEEIYRLIDYTQDTNIREFVINNESNITPNIVRDNSFNPIKNNALADSIERQNSIGSGGTAVEGQTFQQLFTNENITDLQWQIISSNPAIARNNNTYPFLLYKLESNAEIPSPYEIIQAISETNNTKKHIQIRHLQ